MVWERCVGYDTITFHSDPANFADLEEAKRTVYERLARELDAFYEIMQIRAAEMREWANAEEAVQRLLSSESGQGVRNRLLRFFRTPDLVAAAYRSILECEGSVVQNEDECQRKLANLYDFGGDGWLRDIVIQAMKERYKQPTAQRMQLVSFIESRRTHKGENLAVLLAAILGGTVGAILTLAIKHH